MAQSAEGVVRGETENAVANKYIAEMRGIQKPTANTQPTLTMLGVIYNYMTTKKFYPNGVGGSQEE